MCLSIAENWFRKVNSQSKVFRSSVHFFACPKKRTKERAPVFLVPPKAGCPALLDAAGALQTRCAQTVQIPFSAASPVLGCGPMGLDAAYNPLSFSVFAFIISLSAWRKRMRFASQGASAKVDWVPTLLSSSR